MFHSIMREDALSPGLPFRLRTFYSYLQVHLLQCSSSSISISRAAFTPGECINLCGKHNLCNTHYKMLDVTTRSICDIFHSSLLLASILAETQKLAHCTRFA